MKKGYYWIWHNLNWEIVYWDGEYSYLKGEKKKIPLDCYSAYNPEPIRKRYKYNGYLDPATNKATSHIDLMEKL